MATRIVAVVVWFSGGMMMILLPPWVHFSRYSYACGLLLGLGIGLAAPWKLWRSAEEVD